MKVARGGAVGAVLIALLFGSTACVPGEAVPSPTSSPTSSRSASAAQTPSPTPTPTEGPVAEEPADPGPWLISEHGIGPIIVGTATEHVALSGTGVVAGVSEAGCPIFTSPDGWSIMTVGEPIQALSLGRVDNVTPVMNSPRTAEGVGLGSSADEAAAAYPDVAITDDGSRLPHYLVPAGDRYIVILIDEGVVHSILDLHRPDFPLHLC